jgi:hypothetical protein
MNPGPTWRISKDRLRNISQVAAPIASVVAPLPAAIGTAVINMEPQSAITMLVMLSFPITLIVGLQYMLVRPMGLLGWGSAVVGGAIAAGVMMNLLSMQPPPPDLAAVRSDESGGPVGPVGAFFHFIIPGIVTALSFWLIVRLQCPRAYIDEDEDSGSAV